MAERSEATGEDERAADRPRPQNKRLWAETVGELDQACGVRWLAMLLEVGLNSRYSVAKLAARAF